MGSFTDSIMSSFVGQFANMDCLAGILMGSFMGSYMGSFRGGFSCNPMGVFRGSFPVISHAVLKVFGAAASWAVSQTALWAVL
jgi:hypothetical protein